MSNLSPEAGTTNGIEVRRGIIQIERPVPVFTDIYLREFTRSMQSAVPEIRRPSADVVRECGGESEFHSLVNEILVTRILENATQFEQPNASWQSHRRVTADRLTGFEPYFIGTGLDPNLIAGNISNYFNELIKAYRRSHEDYTGPDLFWQMKALLRGQIAPERRGGVAVRGIALLDQIMGTMIHDYRDWMPQEAKAHRAEMQRRVSLIGKYKYKSTGHDFIEKEAHGIVQVPGRAELSPPSQPTYRDSGDLDNPYTFVRNFLGQVGDPVMRGIQYTWSHTRELGIPDTAKEANRLLTTRSAWSKLPYSIVT